MRERPGGGRPDGASLKIPHTRPGVWPEVRAGRLAGAIERDVTLVEPGGGPPRDGGGRPAVVLLGLPDDSGIALNHGRVGAAEGPSAFRTALAAYGTPFDLERRAGAGVRILDAGDVVTAEGGDAEALHETHRRIAEAVRAIHDVGCVPVCVGGGHDLTFPAVRALAEYVAEGSDGPAVSPLGGLSVDAHLDVREAVGSGMPFRRLIEDGHLNAGRFSVFGASRFVHAPEHVAWLRDRGATLFGVDRAREDEAAVDLAFSLAFGSVLARPASPGFVSVDLDAIDGAYAPGVSAVNPLGLDVSSVTTLAERAGRTAGVRHFDIMELSPPHDTDGRTARVAVLVFLHFIAGFAERAA